MSFLIALFTVFLLLVSLFMILIILMQKAKSDGGLGAAMGGGAAESAFGAETNTVLRKATIYCSVVFFVLSFGIYLAHQHQRYQAGIPQRGLDEITPVEEADQPPAGDESLEGMIDPETFEETITGEELLIETSDPAVGEEPESGVEVEDQESQPANGQD